MVDAIINSVKFVPVMSKEKEFMKIPLIMKSSGTVRLELNNVFLGEIKDGCLTISQTGIYNLKDEHESRV